MRGNLRCSQCYKHCLFARDVSVDSNFQVTFIALQCNDSMLVLYDECNINQANINLELKLF